MEAELQKIRIRDPHEKSVVLSQFTSFLKIIEDRLTSLGTPTALESVRQVGISSTSPLLTMSFILFFPPRGIIGYVLCKIDGSMSSKARRNSLSRFASDPDSTVMMVSIRSGGLGLNLTSACNVFLMDMYVQLPSIHAHVLQAIFTHALQTNWHFSDGCACYLCYRWWNPSVDDQAIDRVHRLGQQRTVQVLPQDPPRFKHCTLSVTRLLV